MQSNATLAGPTYVLVAIATLMLQLAIFDRQGFVPHEWAQLALVLGLGIAIRVSDRWSNPKVGRLVAAMVFAVITVLPFVADFIQRMCSSYGNPLEVQLVLCLRNLMIVLGVRRRDLRNLLFATLVSGFLTLFSFLWLMNRWTIALMFIYAVIGMWWLMGLYWNRLSGCFVSRSERRVPWKPVLGASTLGAFALLAALPFAAGTNYTTAVKGILSSSGGTGGQDEFAYGGVGDGPQMVSAKENASGFGPIESELFLESKMPSLYDVMNEFSEPQAKPKIKERQRTIPLAPGQMQQNHTRRGVNQRAGREFSTVRIQKQETPVVSDLKSRALLQVIGRVPVHLGIYAYDTWDGHNLGSSDYAKDIPLVLEQDDAQRNWANLVDKTPAGAFTYLDQHELRIINLKTDRVPAPPSVAGVRIDKLHTEKLFRTTADGMLAMDMERIPQLSILHVKSQQRGALQVPQLVTHEPTNPNGSDLLATMAQSWINGKDKGWPQVKAICNQLQKNYTLDPKAMVPEETDDAVTYFLIEAKRGPDYLFATSAALLLRTLGYETRVVSGFYADPENYDRQSRITSVNADDIHFWVEVLACSPMRHDGGPAQNAAEYWVAIEPSPGYMVLLAPESFWGQLFSRAALTWHALKRNPIRGLVVVALLAIVWRWRSHLLDLIVTAWWLVAHRWGDVRYKVASTVCLLERRARVHGCPRAKGVSLNKWSESLASRTATESWRQPFLDVANWALYGQGIPSQFSKQEVDAICKQAALTWMISTKPHRHGFVFIKRRSA